MYMLCLSNNIEKIWSMECWFSLLDNEFFLFIICIHLLYVNHICSQDKIKFHLSTYLYMYFQLNQINVLLSLNQCYSHTRIVYDQSYPIKHLSILSDVYIYIYIYISHIYEIYSKCWCNSQPKFILHSTYVLIVCERGNNERKNTDKSISDSVNSDDIQFIGWSIYGAYRHTVINAIYIFFSFFILPDKQMSNSFSLVFFSSSICVHVLLNFYVR